MNYDLQVIEEPVEEPVSLEEAKLHLRVDDNHEDSLIQNHIKTAREVAAAETGRLGILTTKIRMSLDRVPRDRVLILPGAPLQSVESVTYQDRDGSEQTLDPSLYYVEKTPQPGYIFMLREWPLVNPNHPRPLTVEYTVGWPSPEKVPASIKAGMLLHIGHLFENREEVVLGASATTLPLASQRLYRPHLIFNPPSRT